MAKRRPSGDGMVRRKEDGRWEGRIVVGHNEKGESIFRYVYGKTQKELLDTLHQNRELYRDVELTEASRMTLGEWLDKWLEEYASVSVRESTLTGYRRYAEHYIKPSLGEKGISKVTTADIQKLYKKLKKEGRVTFATTALEYGMDVKTLSTVIGHNSVSTTLNIYAHITDDMRATAAVNIDRGIAKQEQAEMPAKKAATEKTDTDFVATKGQRRKPGTGCLSQIGENLWEGKYSPRGPDGKKRHGNVYARTREECEEKLKVLIQEMKAEIAAEREQLKKAA